jgi:hypothetical protein
MPCGNPLSYLRYGLGVLRQSYGTYCLSLGRQYTRGTNREALKARTNVRRGGQRIQFPK